MMSDGWTAPFFFTFAFDTEMIVGDFSQSTLSATCFKYSLGQFDTRWDFVFVHFLNRYFRMFAYIVNVNSFLIDAKSKNKYSQVCPMNFFNSIILLFFFLSN